MKILKIVGLTAVLIINFNMNAGISEQNNNDVVVEQSNKEVILPLHLIIKDQSYTTDEKIDKMKNLLQDNTIDINAQDTDGKTALNLVAFLNGDEKIVQFLVESGADVNQPDNFNETPLHNAVKKYALGTIRLLVNAKADKELKNDLNQTPFDLARSHDDAIEALGFDPEFVKKMMAIKTKE